MRPFRAFSLGTSALSAAIVGACVGDDPGTTNTTPGDAGTVDSGGGTTTDSGGNETTDAASDVVAQDSGFCGNQADAALCEDFDHGSYEARGWVSNVTNSGSLQLVASPRSQPFALAARMAAITNQANSSFAKLFHSFAVPAGSKHVHVEADIHLGKRESPGSPCSILAVTTNEIAFDFSDNGLGPDAGQRQLYVVTKGTDGGDVFAVDFGYYDAEWAHYELDLNFGGSSTTLLGKRNGAPMPGSSEIKNVTTLTGATIEIGAGTGTNNFGNGETVHELDNVLVTVD